MQLIDISFLFCGHGFGINTDFVEANVFNLLIVVGIVIVYLGDALNKQIVDRRNTILSYISIVEKSLIKAEQKASLARDELILAQNMANEIHRQLGTVSQGEKQSGIDQANDEIKRSQQSKEDTVNFKKQTTVQTLTIKLVKLACEKARVKLREKAKNREFRTVVMDEQIEKYKIINKKHMAETKLAQNKI